MCTSLEDALAKVEASIAGYKKDDYKDKLEKQPSL
jgi:hypothetical protein